ncbi:MULTISPECIES: hypothetical protein [unclassified Companilactobacillus]|jgi:hypothetical protein|uniref:hypothetical protein n=1 Tax=unclassified Companilactobacillus TaxID=2767904 RepID=UPI002FEED396
MENRTTISYVILKYDKRTDAIYTKGVNNDLGNFVIPTLELDSARNTTSTELKMHIIERLKVVDANIDIDHLFIPFTNVSFSRDTKFYNYSVIIFESDKDVFATSENESWYKLNYDNQNFIWNFTWYSGMQRSDDLLLANPAVYGYVANPDLKDDRRDFCNIMRFVAIETQTFPILGLLSGNGFTKNEVLHYQRLLGFSGSDLKTRSAFERKYSDSIKIIDNDKVKPSYKIKNKYLQK